MSQSSDRSPSGMRSPSSESSRRPQERIGGNEGQRESRRESDESQEDLE
jgi:hypothetical protein